MHSEIFNPLSQGGGALQSDDMNVSQKYNEWQLDMKDGGKRTTRDCKNIPGRGEKPFPCLSLSCLRCAPFLSIISCSAPVTWLSYTITSHRATQGAHKEESRARAGVRAAEGRLKARKIWAELHNNQKLLVIYNAWWERYICPFLFMSLGKKGNIQKT